MHTYTNKYLVKYTGEIGTKSHRTRWRFIHKLSDNIDTALKAELDASDYELCTIQPGWDQTLIDSPSDLSAILSRITGIQYFVKAHYSILQDLNTLAKEAGQHFKERVQKNKTFAVRCRRKGRHSFNSKDIEIKVGDQLIDHGEVDLDDPDITCYIEIKDDDVYFYDTKQLGMKGLPLGVQGKAITMLSGGIDSPVAAWMVYRMGLDQDFVYFDLGGAEQNKALLKAYSFISGKLGYGSKAKLIYIDFLPAIKEIRTAKKSYQNLLLKYFFYKTAEKLAKQCEAQALVTGESIGQVSTQTLQNLGALDRMTDFMVLRPLTGFTKNEIIQRAKQIGTFNLAYKGKEYCAISSKNVVTKSSYDRLLHIAQQLNTDLIDQAIEKSRVYELNNPSVSGQNTQNLAQGVEEKATLPTKRKALTKKAAQADTVIDLRTPEAFHAFSLEKAKNIPFEKAWKDYNHWDKKKSYFLICEVGSRSKMLAHYMEKDGFEVEHLPGGINKFSQDKAPMD